MARVILDAGHYKKYNRSPVVPEYYESDFTWKFHLLLKAELEKFGIEVGTTREDKDTDKGLTARGKMGKGYDLLISIHSDAVSDETIDRVTVIHMTPTGWEHEEASAEFAKMIAPVVSKVMECPQNHKIKTKLGSDTNGDGEKDEYYGILRGADSVKCPAVIIEHSFHTNKRATLWRMDEKNLQALALIEAETIAEFLGVDAEPEPDPTIEYAKGDVNGDGKVSAVDYMMLKRTVDLTYEPTDGERARCDINGDGKVDAADAESLRRYILTGSW